MSLKNIANVCSHLQNASRARLGVTSVPFTKMNLAMLVIMQRHGFISQIRLGGKTPPLALFPPSIRAELTAQDRKFSKTAQSLLKPDLLPTSSDEFVTDSEINFLIAHHNAEPQELQEILAGVEKQLPLHLGTESPNPNKWRVPQTEVNVQRFRDLVERHRPLVKEAKRLVERRDGNLDGLPSFLARVLQPEGASEAQSQAAGSEASQSKSAEANASKAAIDEADESVVTQANRASRRLWLGLKYWKGDPVIHAMSPIATPKKMINVGIREIAEIVRGRGAKTIKPLAQVGEIMILKTSEGVIDAQEALEKHVGGVAIARVS